MDPVSRRRLEARVAASRVNLFDALADIEPIVAVAGPEPAPEVDRGALFTFNDRTEAWEVTRAIFLNDIYYLMDLVIFENPQRPYIRREDHYLAGFRNTALNERRVNQFVREVMMAEETNMDPGEDQSFNSFPYRARTCDFGRSIRMNGYLNSGFTIQWVNDNRGNYSFTLYVGHQNRRFNFGGRRHYNLRPRLQ